VRRQIASLAAAIIFGGAAAVALSSPAQADPCGASSWKKDVNTQSVGYRNCSSGTIWLQGWVSTQFGTITGSCKAIAGNGSATLVNAVTFKVPLQPWGVRFC
jgi:hypothetical protein